jgi:hypothetical protein
MLIATGLGVGFLSAMLGIGGGSLIIPVMVLVFGYSIHTAIATSLIVIVSTSNSAASVNTLKNLVNIRLALFLEMITATGAVCGGLISTNLPEKQLTLAFSIFLIIVAILYFKGVTHKDIVNAQASDSKGVFEEKYFDGSLNKNITYRAKNIIPTTIISGFAGIISGSMGIGGGIFKVPAMNAISKIPMKISTATSNFMIGLTASAGALIYFKSGYVEPVVSGMMVIGVILGSNIAARFFNKLQDSTIKNIFLIFIIFVAIQMFMKAVN